MSLEKSINTAEQLNSHNELATSEQVWPKEAYDASVTGRESEVNADADSPENRKEAMYNNLDTALARVAQIIVPLKESLQASNVPGTTASKEWQYEKAKVAAFSQHLFPVLQSLNPNISWWVPTKINKMRRADDWQIAIEYSNRAWDTIRIQVDPAWTWSYMIISRADLSGQVSEPIKGTF